jgi:hypothetical protein
MPAAVSAAEVAEVHSFLHARHLAHLRCRRRASTIVVESGPHHDVLFHARLKKVSVTTWAAEEFHHSGRWAPLPLHGQLPQVLGAIADDFPWLFDT